MKIINEDKLKYLLRKRISEDIENGRIGGASVAVLQNGKTIIKECLGYKNENEKLTEDTVFRMASMSKPITAAAVMLQTEQGKLALDMPVYEVIPGFEEMYVDGRKVRRPITVEDILSHKSGLPCMQKGNEQLAKMTYEDKQSLKTVVDFYENIELDFEPGEREVYSAVAGFDVLARLVEITSGMSFADFSDKYIFEPMNMKDTTFAPNEEQWSRFTDMWVYSDGKAIKGEYNENCIFSDFPRTYTCGGAGCVSTLNDYLKFAEMLRNKGVGENVRILSEESVRQMQIPRLPQKRENMTEMWGLGVRVNKNGFYPRINEDSFGWSGAFGTHFWIDPRNEITALYMRNSTDAGGSGAITAAHFEEDVEESL